MRATGGPGKTKSAMIRPDPNPFRPQAPEAGPRAMCSSPERALLIPYALTGCRPDQGLAFEAHVLCCDACFEDLTLLDRAAALIGDWSLARVTLADLFYNAPSGEGGRLRYVLDSLTQADDDMDKANLA